MKDTTEYTNRLRQQVDQYREVENIHDLPEIFHYWAGRYLGPPLTHLFGTSDPVQIFVNTFQSCVSTSPQPAFLSIGSGDCSIEIEIARRLKASGIDFVIECTEISDVLLSRGREMASRQGVNDCMRFNEVDINRWQPEGQFAAVMAHHSLHHIVALEHVFDQVHRILLPGGRFVISDMIGRNGHMRWPEALRVIKAIWDTLPENRKYNHQLKRLEHAFVNWDCSREGFEGVRAQDILPLLVDRFDFVAFMPFGNLTDVFVDRSFGHNFDADSPADRAFIDRIHEANEVLIDLGVLKPTMLIATMTHKGTGPTPVHCYREWQPAFCVRSTADMATGESLDTADPPGSTGPVPPETDSTETSCLAAEAAELRKRVGHLEEALDDAINARNRAESRVDELLISTSWRVTAPMRLLKRAMAKSGF